MPLPTSMCKTLEKSGKDEKDEKTQKKMLFPKEIGNNVEKNWGGHHRGHSTKRSHV